MKPYKCPKCDGKGMLTFDPNLPTAQAYISSGPWKCDKCDGGIIWQPEPIDVWSWDVPYPRYFTYS